MITNISFPDLGISGFNINSVFISIFGKFDIYWYAVLITIGILAAFFYAMKVRNRFNVTEDNIYDSLLFAIPSALIGARLYYVLFNLDYYNSIADVFNFRDGGLAIYGALIATVICGIVLHLFKKIKLFDMLDIASIGFLLAQSIGRWGNFFNAEVYGQKTDLPWGMSINGSYPVHPLFLYESILNLIGFFLLSSYSKRSKNRYPGKISLMYVTYYGTVRGLLEGLRDSSYNLMLGSVKISQVIAFATALIAFTVLLFIELKNNKEKNQPEYKKIFDSEDEGINKQSADDLSEDKVNTNEDINTEEIENGTDN